MNIAIAQTHLDPASRSINQRTAIEAICAAAEVDPTPDVLCLPARSDCGLIKDRARTVSGAMSDAFIELISSRTRDMGISTVVGYCETDGDALFDAAAWIDADGDTLLKHHKVAVGAAEGHLLQRGDAIRIKKTLFGLVGLAVSEDILINHVVATMRSMGARIVFAPCHFSDMQAHQEAIAANAKANSLFIVAVNSVGPGGGSGSSTIFGPDGHIQYQVGSSEAESLCASIRMED